MVQPEEADEIRKIRSILADVLISSLVPLCSFHYTLVGVLISTFETPTESLKSGIVHSQESEGLLESRGPLKQQPSLSS